MAFSVCNQEGQAYHGLHCLLVDVCLLERSCIAPSNSPREMRKTVSQPSFRRRFDWLLCTLLGLLSADCPVLKMHVRFTLNKGYLEGAGLVPGTAGSARYTRAYGIRGQLRTTSLRVEQVLPARLGSDVIFRFEDDGAA